MTSASTVDAVRKIDAVYRSESRRVLATLIRLLGDFDLAEDALQEAFAAASEQWPRVGVPNNPRAWLVSAGRFRAIDGIRRRTKHDTIVSELTQQVNSTVEIPEGDDGIEDDRLRLIFTCCHPALNREAQVALTLREVCGLTTEEIAHAFLVPPATAAQRIVRAKRKIRNAGIPYEVPATEELGERLDAVLQVVYLVYNEGYSASSGESVTRSDLSSEAILLARLIVELQPDPEVEGLLALMLFNESRREARSSPDGDVVLLDEQDRSVWDRGMIAEGTALVQSALAAEQIGPYSIQAAISATHASARSTEETDWRQIVALYDLLLRANPSPVVELNRAVAVSMVDGPGAALPLIDAVLAGGSLGDYHLAHAARADMCRRLGRLDDARLAYERALELARQEPERRLLARRTRELMSDDS